MTEFLNLPTGEDMRRVADAVERMASSELGKVTDYTNAPGSKVLVAGTRDNGFYGFVQPDEMGLIATNPAGKQNVSASNLALAIGLAGGSPINEGSAWMKFSRKGEIYLVPVKPLRHSVTWNQIYNQGAVYGDGTVGITPPNGRAGAKLAVDGATNSFTIIPSAAGRGFLVPGGALGIVGNTIVSSGFGNAENNGEFVISAITDTAITVTGRTLVTESGAVKASIYEKTKAVTQNRDVVIGGNRYRVQLLKGASQDPLNSYADADRDMVGPNSEWNNLILPMHEQAKLGNFAYNAYAKNAENPVADWGIGLTDADLVTHYLLGPGSYSWCQETSDVDSSQRVVRGYVSGTAAYSDFSWAVRSLYGWRPVLRLLS
jgi:hypothetical protein